MTTEIYQFDCQLYDQDFILWLETTINHLQKRQLSRLDYDNLIKELSAMGRKEKHSLESNLIVILLHLLKWQYQSEEITNSWQYSIIEHRRRLERQLEDSPSLRNYLTMRFNYCYEYARKEAVAETGLNLNIFPKACPFTSDQALDPAFLP